MSTRLIFLFRWRWKASRTTRAASSARTGAASWPPPPTPRSTASSTARSISRSCSRRRAATTTSSRRRRRRTSPRRLRWSRRQMQGRRSRKRLPHKRHRTTVTSEAKKNRTIYLYTRSLQFSASSLQIYVILPRLLLFCLWQLGFCQSVIVTHARFFPPVWGLDSFMTMKWEYWC